MTCAGRRCRRLSVVMFDAAHGLQFDCAMWNTGLIVFLGIWMALAPFLLPGDAAIHAWNNRLMGIGVVALVIVPRGPIMWELFAAAAVGVWLFVSSFVPALLLDGGDGGLVWNDVATAVLLIALGARATAKTPDRTSPKLPA